MSVKLPNNEVIDARVVARERGTNTERSTYVKSITILIVESDGVLAVIKGYDWDVPEMAVVPLKSRVRFKLSSYDGSVREMEIVEAPPSETSRDES